MDIFSDLHWDLYILSFLRKTGLGITPTFAALTMPQPCGSRSLILASLPVPLGPMGAQGWVTIWVSQKQLDS